MNVPQMWEVWAAQVAPAPIVGPCSITANEARPAVVMHDNGSMSLTGHNPVWYCWTHNLGFGYDLRVRSLSGALGDRCPVSRLEEWRAKRWDAV